MYQPPSSKLVSSNDELRETGFSPRMYWSMYWRSVLVFLISSLFDIPLLFFVDFSSGSHVITLPAASFGLAGLGLLVTNFIYGRGLTYMIWGKRLGLSHEFWRIYGYIYSSGFLVFALVHYLIVQFDSGYYWAISKMVGPTVILLFCPALCCFIASKLTRRT